MAAVAESTARFKRHRRNETNRKLKGWRLVMRYVVLVLVLIFMLGPIFVPLIAAFKSPSEPVFGQGATLFPQTWSLDAFYEIFEKTNLPRAIMNSLTIGLLAVFSHCTLATVGGYMLSRRGWTLRNIAYLVILSAMIFPFESIMLSLFSMMNSIGLYDSIIGVWLPGLLGPLHLLLMRAAFLGIPEEIEDAAFIDDAGEFRRFWSIFLPQVKGALTIVGLTSFIYAWSDFLWPLLMLRSAENQTMMLALNSPQESAPGTTYRTILAGAIIALAPVLLLFAFTQRYFFRGIEEGGLNF
ncbi:ABC transporter permease [Bowdeniella nasicola]|uniref:ABC transporter permease n=1 Tax=Bowdeniella nasicola TaxID=208480 RepID=A0A1Q5Q5Q4_9ACTO|nr:carbohydrate ABC transporter permease [Bowdeniella nasicola]OKL55121.1 ABC transporter permease [Bowdeniella nasicola]